MECTCDDRSWHGPDHDSACEMAEFANAAIAEPTATAGAMRAADRLAGIGKIYATEREACAFIIDTETGLADLLEALKRMVGMYEAFMEQGNLGASAFSAKTLQELNEAPIQAAKAIAKAEGD